MIVSCFNKRVRYIIGDFGVCKFLVGVHHFLLVKALKINPNKLETHSGKILCDLQPSISQNLVGANAHNITETIYLQCLLFLVFITWIIPAYKYCKVVYTFTEGSWGGLESWDGTYAPLSQLTWDIFWGNKKKNRKQPGGGYYQKIQNQIIMSYVFRAEGGIKILNFGMEKYMGVKNLF